MQVPPPRLPLADSRMKSHSSRQRLDKLAPLKAYATSTPSSRPRCNTDSDPGCRRDCRRRIVHWNQLLAGPAGATAGEGRPQPRIGCSYGDLYLCLPANAPPHRLTPRGWPCIRSRRSTPPRSLQRLWPPGDAENSAMSEGTADALGKAPCASRVVLTLPAKRHHRYGSSVGAGRIGPHSAAPCRPS